MRKGEVKYYSFGVLESDPKKFVVIGLSGPFEIGTVAFHSEQELRSIFARGGASEAEIKAAIEEARKHFVK